MVLNFSCNLDFNVKKLTKELREKFATSEVNVTSDIEEIKSINISNSELFLKKKLTKKDSSVVLILLSFVNEKNCFFAEGERVKLILSYMGNNLYNKEIKVSDLSRIERNLTLVNTYISDYLINGKVKESKVLFSKNIDIQSDKYEQIVNIIFNSKIIDYSVSHFEETKNGVIYYIDIRFENGANKKIEFHFDNVSEDLVGIFE